MSQTTNWYVKDVQGQVYGPLAESAVVAQIQSGFFLGQELVAKEKEARWFPITQHPTFFEAIVEGLNKELMPTDSPEAIAAAAAAAASEEATFVDTKGGAGERPEPLWKTLQIETPPIEEKPEEIPPPPPSLPPPAPPPPVPESSARKLLYFAAAAVLVLTAVLWGGTPDAQPARDRIRLRAVKFSPKAVENPASEGTLRSAVIYFRKHTINDYLKSQEILVTGLEKDSAFLDAMGFLCMTYKELWPYSYQDSRDIETIYSVFRQASVLKANSASAGVCYVTYLLVIGEYEKSKNYMEDALRREPNLLFYNQLIGDLLEQQKKYSTASYYFQKVSEIWPPPPWAKPVLQLARTQRKLKRYNEALENYRTILKFFPEHPLAMLELGVLEFEAFRQAEKANTMILKAIQSKSQLPSEIRAEGYFVLAQISQQMGYKKKALEYANQAFSIDSGNTAVKEFILNLGGRSALDSVQIDSSNMLYLGTQYMKLGNYYAAQAEFRLAFEADPRNALAAYHAGQALWELNQSTEAIKWVEKAIHADPGLVSAYVTLSDYYSYRHNYDGAMQILKNVLRRFPRNNEIYRGFANIEYKRGNKKAAIQYAQKALESYSMDVGALQIIARSYLDVSDYTTAANFIDRALEVDPHTPENHGLYAKVISGIHGPSAGIDYLNRKIDEAPEVIAYRKSLAEIFIDEKNWNGARAILENIMSAKKEDKSTALSLAFVYRQEGYMNKSLEMYLLAASYDPLDPTPLFQAGELYFQAGNYKSAIAQFERVIKINKNFPRVYYYLGKAALENKEYEKAIEMASVEKTMNPSLAEPYLLAAEAHSKLGQFSNCASEYQKAIMRRPQSSEIYVNIARCYRLAGVLDSAIQMLDQAAQKESGNPEIYRELGSTFHMQGLMAEAYSAYERYLHLAPNAADRAEIERVMAELKSYQ